MEHALYTGTIKHRRFQPRNHQFQYKFFMWFLNLDTLSEAGHMKPWLSLTPGKAALYRFNRADYLGDPALPLADAVRQRMLELTGEKVRGQVCGLMNLRSLGIYFSPVNFYFGFDNEQKLTHFMAEVSNIPWNRRHHYAHYVAGNKLNPANEKEFHVSPFNPMDQQYSWRITAPGKEVGITIEVDDARGKIFQADLSLERQPLTAATLAPQILKKPVMTAFIVGGIYYQALRLFLKKVPYIPYPKEAT